MNFEQKENPIIINAVPEDAREIQELTILASSDMYKLCGWTNEEIRKHFPIEKQEENIKKLETNISQFRDKEVLLVSRNNLGRVIGFIFFELGGKKID